MKNTEFAHEELVYMKPIRPEMAKGDLTPKVPTRKQKHVLARRKSLLTSSPAWKNIRLFVTACKAQKLKSDFPLKAYDKRHLSVY